MSTIKRIALTAGEPAGIGPDLCIEMAQQNHAAEIVVLADPSLLTERARQLGLPISIRVLDLTVPPKASKAGEICCLSHRLNKKVINGVLDPENSGYVMDTLNTALSGCINNDFDAVVTAPVHKGVINDAGFAFTGHTEFFAEGADIEKVVMMLATSELRVALATTHLPLKKVASTITSNLLKQVISIIHVSFQQQFDIAQPRIAVCGLNPHAGEGGYLGDEEITMMQPAINTMLDSGIAVSGPWPADTIFNKDKLADFDVVLAMYHDQGLPVLKHAGFGKAVNVTLGLPFIRTSVDHGTALDLAGTGKASASSLVEAINMAIAMADKAKSRH